MIPCLSAASWHVGKGIWEREKANLNKSYPTELLLSLLWESGICMYPSPSVVLPAACDYCLKLVDFLPKSIFFRSP